MCMNSLNRKQILVLNLLDTHQFYSVDFVTEKNNVRKLFGNYSQTDCIIAVQITDSQTFTLVSMLFLMCPITAHFKITPKSDI